jgi:hypothetical protein
MYVEIDRMKGTMCLCQANAILDTTPRETATLGKLNDTQNTVQVHVQNLYILINKESGNLGAVTQKYAVPSS